VAVRVSVIGSGADHERAEEIGRLLAKRGCTVVCGGLGEVMAAAARGAKSASGTTIGILPGTNRAEANEWIDHVVMTGLGHARNAVVVASGDGVIAVGGSYGTLTEIGFARIYGRPVVILEPVLRVEGVPRAATPREAVEFVLASVASSGRVRHVGRRRPSTARCPVPHRHAGVLGRRRVSMFRASARPTRGASARTLRPCSRTRTGTSRSRYRVARRASTRRTGSNGMKPTTRSSLSGETNDMRCRTSRPRRWEVERDHVANGSNLHPAIPASFVR
jgi:uncharacterized protein (TIGR00725 family)